MKIISWQDSMSTHQFHMWKELQKLTGEEIAFVLEKASDLPTKEVRLDDLRKLGPVIFPDGNRWKTCRAILSRYSDAVHVFGGFRNVWYFFPLILYSLAHNIKIAIFNEPYSIYPMGYFREEPNWLSRLKVGTRPLLYSLMAFLMGKAIRQEQPCLLPISLIARDQFTRSGFSLENLYPFGYFVPGYPVSQTKPPQSPGKIRLIFVGSLLLTKGLDIGVKAVEELCLRGFDVSLDIYGFGSPERFISPSSKCVHYRGILVPASVQSVIRQYDMLILPSRHDGWGVVVNEALLQGIPVIVSDRVGAKCIVEISGAGLTFETGDVEDLTIKLEELIRQPGRFDEMSRKAAAIGDSILPAAGAGYLLNVFRYHFYHEGGRPIAFWSGNTPINTRI